MQYFLFSNIVGFRCHNLSNPCFQEKDIKLYFLKHSVNFLQMQLANSFKTVQLVTMCSIIHIIQDSILYQMLAGGLIISKMLISTSKIPFSFLQKMKKGAKPSHLHPPHPRKTEILFSDQLSTPALRGAIQTRVRQFETPSSTFHTTNFISHLEKNNRSHNCF